MAAEFGVSFDQDRHWKISGPDFEATMTDYNWEVTGWSKELIGVVKYTDNAYWFVFTECPRRGWKAAVMPRQDCHVTGEPKGATEC